MTASQPKALAENRMKNLLIEGLNSPVGLTLDEVVKKLRQRAFNKHYSEWISEQNRLVERYGIFGEEYRTW